MPPVAACCRRLFGAHSSGIRLLAVLLVALPGCMDGPEEPPAVTGYGAIEGYILECGAPVAVEAVFDPLNSTGPDAHARVRPDSTGWYRVELPVGKFRVNLRPLADDGRYSDNFADDDTVHVGHAVRRRDFRRGRALVVARLPEPFEGRLATLRLFRPDATAVVDATVAGGNARFDLRLVPRLGYVMRLDPGWDGVPVMLPGTYLVANADSLLIADEPVTYEVDLRDRFARIEGRVTGSWQSTEMPMMVYAVGANGATRSSVVCAPDGSFRLDLVAPDQVRLVSHCGSLDRWFGGATYGTATLHSIVPGQLLDGRDLIEGGLRLALAGDGDFQEHLGDALLVYPDGTRRGLNLGYRNPVDLPNLAAGEYRLQLLGGCALDSWLPQWFGGADEADAVPIVVAEGAFTEVTFHRERGGVLAGVFTGPDESVSDGRRIHLRDADGGYVCEDGAWFWGDSFRWPGLPDGTYYLSLEAGSVTWWYPGTSDFAQAAMVTISDGADVKDLVWELPELQVVIRK